MKRKPLTLLLAVILLTGCSDKDEEKSKTPAEYLTGSGSKSWNFIEVTPDDEDPGCAVDAAFMRDNKLTFFANGDYEFDNGTVTNHDCEECECSDLLNLYGTWSFPTTSTLKVMAEGLLVDGEREPSDDTEVLLNATIVKLTDTELVISENGSTAKLVPVD